MFDSVQENVVEDIADIWRPVHEEFEENIPKKILAYFLFDIICMNSILCLKSDFNNSGKFSLLENRGKLL